MRHEVSYRLIIGALVAVLATFAVPLRPVSPAAADADLCSRVLGGSQTTNWYKEGNFESFVVDAEWEKQTRGGQSIGDWGIGGTGWDTTVWSACGQGGSPGVPVTRAVLNVLPDHGDEYGDVLADVEAAIEGIHTNLPDATRITLVPPVGGDCPGVTLAESQPMVVDVIAAAIGGEVDGGPTVVVPDCAMFRDEPGHLTSAGAEWAAEQMALGLTAPTGDTPPSADAGPDQFVVLDDGATEAEVTLDGSGSSDDGAIVSYVWEEGGIDIATGVGPTVTLREGVHELTLTVTDDAGATDSDVTVITLAVASPAGSVHIGDLDGAAARQRKLWTATVTITVLSATGPVPDAEVAGSWVGASGGTSCTTNADGICTVVSNGLAKEVASAGFSVTNVIAAGPYDPAANTDPDGDSDGTTITVLRP